MARRARVVGLDRLEKKFKALPAAVEVGEIRLAMESRPRQRSCGWRSRWCPSAAGRLRHSIGWTWGAAPRGSVAIAEVSTRAASHATIYAGNDAAFYARWSEYLVPHRTSRAASSRAACIRARRRNRSSIRPIGPSRKGAKRKAAAAASPRCPQGCQGGVMFDPSGCRCRTRWWRSCVPPPRLPAPRSTISRRTAQCRPTPRGSARVMRRRPMRTGLDASEINLQIDAPWSDYSGLRPR